MKKIPTFILGVVVGGVLFSGVTVGAATVYYKATVANVKVVIDGKEAKLSDKPLNVNNRLYLPVRDTANSMNYEVSTVNSERVELKSMTVEKVNNSTYTPEISSPIVGEELEQAPPIINEPTSVISPEENNVAKAKIGEPITKNGITVSIDKIEYMPEGEILGNIKLSKGFKLFFNITNNSTNSNISDLGGLFEFKTGSLTDDKNVNMLGNLNYLKVSGQEYSGKLLSYGESASGFIYYQINEDILIKEVSYTPSLDNVQQRQPLGRWEVK